MSPNHRFDIAFDGLLDKLGELAPYLVAASLTLALFTLAIQRLVRSLADRHSATALLGTAAPPPGVLRLLAAASAVHAPLSYAAVARPARPQAALGSDGPERALAQLPAGVYLVTVGDRHGRPHAIVLTSLCVHGGDPATVLVCIAADEPGSEHLLAAPAFGVHLLSREQHALAQREQHVGRGVFDLAGWRWERGVPVRGDVAACLRCETVGVSRHGAHAVVIGAVSAVLVAGEREPLIRLHGRADWYLSDDALSATRS